MRTLVKLLTYAAIAAVLYGVVHFGILFFTDTRPVGSCPDYPKCQDQ